MVCTHPDLLARICKLVERKKNGLICFPRLIYCDQEPLLLINVTEDYITYTLTKVQSEKKKVFCHACHNA